MFSFTYKESRFGSGANTPPSRRVIEFNDKYLRRLNGELVLPLNILIWMPTGFSITTGHGLEEKIALFLEGLM